MLSELISGPKPVTELFAVSLARVPPSVLGSIGGKGKNLAELIQAGLPVPEGFVLAFSAFEAFRAQPELRSRIEGVADSLEAREELRRALEAAPIPEEVRARLLASYAELGGGLVAVRSSAAAEDSDESSFAGQYDTVLGVNGEEALLAAVKRVWASPWSERCHSYRRARGLERVEPIAVVIQRMLDPDVAGVLFTKDPVRGESKTIVIEACLGLGEGIVAGRVAADTFFVDRSTHEIVRSEIAYKLHACRLAEDGVRLEKVEPTRREQPALDAEQIGRLAQHAGRLIAHYGRDQDVEWALEGERLYLLQARPVTSGTATTELDPNPGEPEARMRQRTLWSRMDVGEIFNGQMTPLGISFAKYYQFNVHADCIRAVGCLHSGDPNRYMGYLQGHVYLNVSYSAYLISQTPPNRDGRRFTERFASHDVDLSGYENPYGSFPEGEALERARRFWTRSTLRELALMQRRARRLVASRYVEYDRFRTLELPRMKREALWREMQRALVYFHDVHVGYMPFYINAFAFYGGLEVLCQRWLGDAGQALQNRLKADMSNLRTVQAVREIQELVAAARAYPGVLDIVEQTPPAELETALSNHAEGRRFLGNEYRAFMRENGVRTRQEMELTNRCWVDDPSYVAQMMRRFRAESADVEEVALRGRIARGEDTARILGSLPRTRRAAFEGLIRMYSLCSELREQVRMAMITSVWMVRSIVYEVARRLCERGLLRSMDELGYLDFFDVLAHLRGAKDASVAFARAGVETRKREHASYRRLPAPPLSLIGSYDTRASVPSSAAATVLSGLGTSPGRVIGRARILKDVIEQADELRPGDVLVTSATDASWTPLFLIASAVVTDVGSMLSHSSIVAREFNIPAVVNTKHATALIRSGDVLVVDGTAGQVEIQRAEGAGAVQAA